jgi:DNA-binding MarR family transcriptional regulator
MAPATDAAIAAIRARCPALDEVSARALLALCAAPSGGRALARKLGLAQSDVFRAFSTLGEAGLVRAVPPLDDDPLRRTLAPTPLGLRLWPAAQTKTPPVRPGGV